MKLLPLNRKQRFRRLCRRAGLRPASTINRLPHRRPEVDLTINSQLDGEGSAWLNGGAR